MKLIFKYFFRTLRIILGPFMLLWEKVTAPSSMPRSPELQMQIDQQSRALTLYQFKTCPFCIKVRQELRRIGLKIEFRDAQHDQQHRAVLLQEGGQIKVPCLKIDEKEHTSRWLYESGAIIEYLRQRFT